MKKIKRGYYYLFYKFYKMSEAAPSRWLSDWKAGLVIIVLEIWCIISFMNYYNVIIDKSFDMDITSPIIIIAGLIILLINYFAFIHTDIWKEYVKEYEALPKSVNRKRSWIVWGCVLFVITNLIFSFYLMSRVDWSQYR